MSGELYVRRNEANYKFYEIMPPEVRTIVIDTMEPDDKAKFCQCSKRTNIETKVSKKFVYGLEFHAYTKDDLQIEVLHGEYEHYKDMRHGFYWQFKNEDGKKTMECTNLDEKLLWKLKLDDSTDLVEYAANQFKAYLQKYQRTVKKLFIDNLFKMLGERENEYNLELQSLTSVKELKFYDSTGIHQIMSMLRRPLKLLEVIGIENSRLLPDCKSLYRVSQILLASECRVNYEQLKELSAERIEINMGDLTEEEIADFIDTWKNGTMDKMELGYYRWELKNSEFSLVKFFKLFDSEFDGSSTKTLRIKHNKEAGKEAEVYFNNNGAIVDKKYLSFKEI